MENEENDESCQKLLDNFKHVQHKTSENVETVQESTENICMEDQSVITEQLQSIVDVFTFEEESSNQAMITKLKIVWRNFLTFVNQRDIQDFVNFRIVARILQDLSREHEFKSNRIITFHNTQLSICMNNTFLW